jgi:hypothetical protein
MIWRIASGSPGKNLSLTFIRTTFAYLFKCDGYSRIDTDRGRVAAMKSAVVVVDIKDIGGGVFGGR